MIKNIKDAVLIKVISYLLKGVSFDVRCALIEQFKRENIDNLTTEL
jgi:hypothetical protein